ncbi:GTPase Der [Thermoclostridium stercorarium subsp. stercorarium DSM 8532]|uniref:GTPase Der n=3 Tax=Thermoclostridium stercorarium TaxID=1510 RepID=L7VQ97_THES1|nr:ribosome biogenesis GTPase Der [Thermoclostridium stercorarium]AGC68977.1 GTPase Der [Thermoclostridium stercorarium subsp. stercorarium DSM 8532]AGI39956.1 EngA [Thermoclostridium stercorarium subsp. stercorarium DSM 8532]ANW99277.1 ribosome biogenesis GTPase Der [Thermoclostridium stercorarium subsp. thermolacticum DSM 2910]ANX01906.1 ribosome biogenesis GTPase Der [Thermoclostridium stercorarium subsp. leptospartum DSM 9219]UZQ84949.1 ribosome biogenesis GTPase Der [Thermoclostridium ste
MSKPVVAIVGRPNVGKSTLFNYITGRRISITEDTPGITRDRIYAEAEWRGRKFTLIDTGGIEPDTDDYIKKMMLRQAELAMETADVIIFLLDMKTGLTAADNDVAAMLRKSKKPVIVAVNKVDNIGELPPDAYEFYNLGMGDFYPISSVHGLGIGELLDAVFEYFPEEAAEEQDDDIINVAVIGRPNVGKSSLINCILGEERVIVSDVPGTTRDAIDTLVIRNGKRYNFIDTAGIRRKSRIEENIERYSVIRSFMAVDRSDVCLIVIDANDGVTEQDTKIAGYAHEQGKASVIAVNKWDMIEKETGTLEKMQKEILQKLDFMSYAPVVFISAKTGQRVEKLFELVDYVFEQASLRIQTGMLNDVLNEAMAMVQPPSDKGKRLKIYYMTQTGIRPPKFVLFINDKELMHFSYERYIINTLRSNFGFAGTPIQLIMKEKQEE